MIENFDPSQIEFWHWGVVGLVLLILEVMVSGFFLIWLGVAALVVALLMIFVTMSWPVQLTIWAVLSMADLFAWRMWRKSHPPKSADSTLNRRGEQYIGRRFTLEEPIVNGVGKVKVDDSIWKVECDQDLAAGTAITVTTVEGTVFKVEAA